ncbi:MAG: winged helix-turn-helix transcriptional regulator [Methanomassiliicoccaceae archaeon]|nr:winged helix-turn-helix transcriptional regulator [Methanomassiliicoccaceae archaeon]
MHEARREALANALLHSDYNGRRGLVIEKKRNEIVISNPGALRISKEEALNGGVSDPRNSVLFSMFALVGIGERAGSGMTKIEVAWKEENLPSLTLSEQFNPDRTILTLPLTQNASVNDGVNDGVKLTKTEVKILELLKNNGQLTALDLSNKIGVYIRTVERGLKKLKDRGLVERIGSDKMGEWKVLR